MRKPVLILTVAALAAALVSPGPSAVAVGPGGWEHVGVGSPSTTPSLDGPVFALNTQKPGVLLVGGAFTSAGGHAKAKRIAQWNGSTWSPIGNTPLSNGSVNAIAYHAGKVYVGGTFLNAGGNPDADFLAVWDGSTWAPACSSTVPGPAITATVSALQIIGNTLYVAGSFADGAGIASADRLVRCDLTTGAPSTTVTVGNEFNGGLNALTADSNGILYAGGSFQNLAGIADADHIASFDGANWHAMGTGPAIDSFVRSLTAVGTTVYAGTDSTDVAGIAQADHVARWDGSAWSAVGSDSAGTNGWFPTTTSINSLTTDGSLVIAGGSFQNADGRPTADEIAYFDGSAWHPLGSNGAGNGPLNQQAGALAAFNGKVFAGGSFTNVGGDRLASNLADTALRQPDLSVGGSVSGHFTGAHVFSSTGAGEALDLKVRRGGHQTAYVRIQNRGIVTAAMVAHATGGAHGIKARYFQGSTNVTSAVQAGTWTPRALAPGAFVLLRVVVKVGHGSAATTTFVVRAKASGASPDAVRIKVKATG